MSVLEVLPVNLHLALNCFSKYSHYIRKHINFNQNSDRNQLYESIFALSTDYHLVLFYSFNTVFVFSVKFVTMDLSEKVIGQFAFRFFVNIKASEEGLGSQKRYGSPAPVK